MTNSSSPPILPISTAQPSVTTTTTTTATAAIRTYLSTITTSLRSARPWPELLDRTAFSKPSTLTDAALRLRKNYHYFRTNYLVLIAAAITLSLLTNPLSLLLLTALLAAWLKLYVLRRDSNAPVIIFNREFSEFETTVMLICSTMVVILFTSVGSVLMSACMVGFGIVCLHGAFRVPEDLFLDGQEAQSGGGGSVSGFLTFSAAAHDGGAAASAAVASIAPPQVAVSRV